MACSHLLSDVVVRFRILLEDYENKLNSTSSMNYFSSDPWESSIAEAFGLTRRGPYVKTISVETSTCQGLIFFFLARLLTYNSLLWFSPRARA